MNWQDDESSDKPSLDEIRRRTGVTIARVRTCRYYLWTRGVDAKEFLQACEDMDKVLAGGPMPEGGMERILAVIGDFTERLKKLPDFPPQWSEKEAAIWAGLSALMELEEDTHARIGGPGDGSPRDARRDSLAALRERLQQALQNPGDAQEVLEDLRLETLTQKGELDRRQKFTVACTAIYWEQMPQEKWDSMDSATRGRFIELLGMWRAERENILSELPIADRRRLEAMEHFGPEDWKKPGVCRP